MKFAGSSLRFGNIPKNVADGNFQVVASTNSVRGIAATVLQSENNPDFFVLLCQAAGSKQVLIPVNSQFDIRQEVRKAVKIWRKEKKEDAASYAIRILEEASPLIVVMKKWGVIKVSGTESSIQIIPEISGRKRVIASNERTESFSFTADVKSKFWVSAKERQFSLMPIMDSLESGAYNGAMGSYSWKLVTPDKWDLDTCLDWFLDIHSEAVELPKIGEEAVNNAALNLARQMKPEKAVFRGRTTGNSKVTVRIGKSKEGQLLVDAEKTME